MQIADLDLEVAAPGDLEERIHALTGATAAEVRALLAGNVIAGFVAKALHPFLVEARELAELAQKIAEHGIAAIKAEVAALYDQALGIAVAEQGSGGDQSEEGAADDEAEG